MFFSKSHSAQVLSGRNNPCIEAQHAEFGIALVHLLAIPSAVVFGKVDGGRQQVVGIERGIEIGVQFKEGFQVVFGVGLPFRIAEQMDTAFGRSRTNKVNWGSILINVRLLPDVGINIFSRSVRNTVFKDSTVTSSFRLFIGMERLRNSSFSPLMKSAFSLVPWLASMKMTLALGNWRTKWSYTSEYR